MADDIEKLFNDLDDTPLSEDEYNELMKFKSDDHEIDISSVEFRISTAHEICEKFNLGELLMSMGDVIKNKVQNYDKGSTTQMELSKEIADYLDDEMDLSGNGWMDDDYLAHSVNNFLTDSFDGNSLVDNLDGLLDLSGNGWLD